MKIIFLGILVLVITFFESQVYGQEMLYFELDKNLRFISKDKIMSDSSLDIELIDFNRNGSFFDFYDQTNDASKSDYLKITHTKTKMIAGGPLKQTRTILFNEISYTIFINSLTSCVMLVKNNPKLKAHDYILSDKLNSSKLLDSKSKIIDNQDLLNKGFKYTAFLFWFPSCGGCVTELKRYSEFRAKYDSKTVNFILISSLDFMSQVQKFRNKHKHLPDQYFCSNETMNSFWNVCGYPSFLIVNNDKQILYYAFGISMHDIVVKYSN